MFPTNDKSFFSMLYLIIKTSLRIVYSGKIMFKTSLGKAVLYFLITLDHEMTGSKDIKNIGKCISSEFCVR